MSKKTKKILEKLDEIMDPLDNHIKKLEAMCSKDGIHPVTESFLAMYKTEYLKYQELRILILEIFNDIKNKD